MSGVSSYFANTPQEFFAKTTVILDIRGEPSHKNTTMISYGFVIFSLECQLRKETLVVQPSEKLTFSFIGESSSCLILPWRTHYL